jgi:hypothetical protein
VNTPLPITIPPDHIDLLRSFFTACAKGRRGDVERQPDSGANPRRLEEAEAFEDLRISLSTYTLVPSRGVREALCALAAGVDAGNEYAVATREHAAVHGLLDQIKAAL